MKNQMFKCLLPISLFLIVSSCDLGDGVISTKGDVILDITYWNLPDTSKVSVPFNLFVESCILNSCVSKLQFNLIKGKDFEYAVVAKAVYENNGEACNAIEVFKDSTIAITHATVGKYYYYFWTNSKYEKDSIYIKP